MRKGKAHGVVIDFINGGYQAAKLQAFKVGVAAVRDVVIRMIDVFLAHKREDHVIGVKIPGRREGFIALKFHALAQMEGVNLAVVAHLPALRQARHQLRGAGFEIDQPVIDRHGAGVDAGSRGV